MLVLARVAPQLLRRAASVRSFTSRDDLPGFDASRAATGSTEPRRLADTSPTCPRVRESRPGGAQGYVVVAMLPFPMRRWTSRLTQYRRKGVRLGLCGTAAEQGVTGALTPSWSLTRPTNT
jgi:hypothetical protein